MDKFSLPPWLTAGRNLDHTKKANRKNFERSIRYYRQKHQATPPWLSEDQKKQIRDIYREKGRRRERGERVVVDHIVPLLSDTVCGLEVPWNLQIITEIENVIKSNTQWPDCPEETLDLAGDFEPYQMRLPL